MNLKPQTDTTGKSYFVASGKKFYFRPESKNSIKYAAHQARLYEIAVDVLDQDEEEDEWL